MAVRAADLLLFVGAGASRSMPAGLPMFDAIRETLLEKIGLKEDPHTAELVPEPFMLELSRSQVEVVPWVREMLGGAAEPNAAHQALAQLAARGAALWTVNFDTLIEQASSGTLTACAWPASPATVAATGAVILKPHGSLGGELIVTAEQVLRGLDPAWEERLRADVTGRTVVFLGYRGRDLDFQPIWDDVLATARRVLWFDRADPKEDRRKRQLLRRADDEGRLELRPQVPPPPGAPADGLNPSWDFVHWCRSEGLANPDQALVLRLFEKPPAPAVPELIGKADRAKPAVQGMLGDIRGARKSYRAMLCTRDLRYAARSLVVLRLNHGGRSVAFALRAARLIPPVGRLRQARQAAEWKRLTALSKTGHYRAVLRGTARLPDDAPSTPLILRSASLRSADSLDEAAMVAALAVHRARYSEQHPIRLAHAAFQRSLALVWAQCLDDARICLEDELAPYGALAASRWVAWTDFVRGCLAVRDGQPSAALDAFGRSERRFEAEKLVDGVTSVLTARLAALRALGRGDDFRSTVAELATIERASSRDQLRYARNHRFTQEAVILERAEFARVHEQDQDAAARLYQEVSASPYPLHSAQANLGLGMLEAELGREPGHAWTALITASRIGARLHASRAQALLLAPPAERPEEFFFC
ncbi:MULTISPECIES: SIR2 family protein [Streptacidiphilus]|uniref:SIR2 family protein n=1 Tax=Streptacidiphilus cavernicola TaxID=3342716 RepID=A0ABV6UK30_9ACTN|nr:SIR2 family protein [Streptacidiphilus jeojiense]